MAIVKGVDASSNNVNGVWYNGGGNQYGLNIAEYTLPTVTSPTAGWYRLASIRPGTSTNNPHITGQFSISTPYNSYRPTKGTFAFTVDGSGGAANLVMLSGIPVGYFDKFRITSNNTSPYRINIEAHLHQTGTFTMSPVAVAVEAIGYGIEFSESWSLLPDPLTDADVKAELVPTMTFSGSMLTRTQSKGLASGSTSGTYAIFGWVGKNTTSSSYAFSALVIGQGNASYARKGLWYLEATTRNSTLTAAVTTIVPPDNGTFTFGYYDDGNGNFRLGIYRSVSYAQEVRMVVLACPVDYPLHFGETQLLTTAPTGWTAITSY